MADLDSDSRQLLAPEADGEVHPGPMNIQFESSDLRPNRPFHVEPTHIVSVSGVLQRVSDRASAMNKRIHYYSRLAAPADQALVAPDHVVPAPEERYVYSPLGSAYKLQSCPEGSGKNTSLVTIFMIWNTMMGTSILSIPWGIKQAGFTTGVCVILLMGLLTLYCCYRVLRSPATIPSVDTAAWEFPDVCRHYFGAFGQWSSLLFSLVSLVGAMIVYWVLMSNFLFNTGKFMFNFIHHINDTDAALSTNDSNPVTCPSAGSGRPNNGSAIFSANATGLQQFERWWDKSQTVPFYLVGLLLPLLNFKSPSFFSKFNVLGTVAIVYLTFLVTLKAARLGFHLEFHWFTPTEFFVPEMRARFPQLTGVLTLAFFIHNCVITLLKNNKNQENNVRDLAVAYLLVTLTYLYIGVLVFASFPSPPLPKDCIEQNFLDNFPSTDVLSFVARIFLLFQMVTVYPLLGYLARVQLLGHVFGDPYPRALLFVTALAMGQLFVTALAMGQLFVTALAMGQLFVTALAMGQLFIFHVLVLNLIIVGAGVSMACLYPNIGGIIRYSGAACGLAFVFVYPSLTHVLSLRQEGRLTWPSLLFHALLIVLGLANLVAQFFM